jgi:hypothetical protein
MHANAVDLLRLQFFEGGPDERFQSRCIHRKLAMQNAPGNLDRKPHGIGLGATNRFTTQARQFPNGVCERLQSGSDLRLSGFARGLPGGTDTGIVCFPGLLFRGRGQLGNARSE